MEIFEGISQFIQTCVDNLDYGNIALLMGIESSFIPFPSEIIVPPAGYLAASGKLNIFLVVIFATIGSILGALVNYILAYILGRPVLYAFANSKVGHLCLLSQDKLEKAEQYFNENGAVSTFVGRLIPGIRQLISIPAGLVKMSIWKFLAYTALGAGIWNAILAIIGYALHKTIGSIDKIPELASKYGKLISAGIVVILIVIGVIYYFKKKNNKSEQTEVSEKEKQD